MTRRRFVSHPQPVCEEQAREISASGEVDAHSRITASGLRRAAVRCEGRSYLDGCVYCGRRRVRWCGCGKVNCEQPGCRKRYSTQRGKRIAKRLGRLGALPWVVLVLTTPLETRGALLGRVALRRVRRAIVEMVSDWAVRWMFHGVPVRIGGCVTMHPEGDETPGRWAPHWNVLIPSLGFLDDGAEREGRWHVPVSALEDLRYRWGRILEGYGFAWDCAPQVFVEHRHELGQKYHAARYFGRSFPAWQKHAQAVSYFGTLAGKSPAISVRHALPVEELDPSNEVRCPCGGWYNTIAIAGPNGEWVPVGAGPPPCGPERSN